MKARVSSKFGQIQPPTAELNALERLKNPHRLIMGKTFCAFSQLFSIGFILYLQVTGTRIYKSLDEFEIRPDLTMDCGVSCIVVGEIIPIELKCGKCCGHSR